LGADFFGTDFGAFFTGAGAFFTGACAILGICFGAGLMTIGL